MKLFADEVQASIKLNMDYDAYEKNKPTEKQEKEADRRILERQKAFEEAKILDPKNIASYFKELELAQIHRRQLLQNYIDGKDKLAEELRSITRPVIEGYASELLGELKRIDGKKVYSVLEDRENLYADRGGQVFKAKHNYYFIGQVERQILDTIEKLRGMDCSSLPEIRKIFDEAIQNLPEVFPMEESEGGEELKTFFLENRPRPILPDEIQNMFMYEVVFAEKFAKEVAKIGKERPAKQWAEEQANKEIDMTKPTKRQGPIFDGI